MREHRSPPKVVIVTTYLFDRGGVRLGGPDPLHHEHRLSVEDLVDVGGHVPQSVDESFFTQSETSPLPMRNSAVRRSSASAGARSPSILSLPRAPFARAALSGRIGDRRGIPDGAERELGGAVEAGVVPERALL